MPLPRRLRFRERRNRLCVVIDRPSNSAATLAGALGVKRVRPSRLSVLNYGTVINWGNGNVPSTTARIINSPEAVRVASSKVSTFERIPEQYRPRYSRTPFVPSSGILLARADGRSSGEGITVVRQGETPPPADFYVEYVRKEKEYRVHVAFGRAIHVQQKRKRREREYDRDASLIRNHSNGWVFTEVNVEFPSDAIRDAVLQAAIACVSAVGLDFGAVDLILERGTNRVVFLEVNTRPGIESTRTTQAYAGAFSANVQR